MDCRTPFLWRSAESCLISCLSVLFESSIRVISSTCSDISYKRRQKPHDKTTMGVYETTVAGRGTRGNGLSSLFSEQLIFQYSASLELSILYWFSKSNTYMFQTFCTVTDCTFSEISRMYHDVRP